MWQFYSACIYCTLYRVSLSDTEPTECGGTGTWPGRGGGGGGGGGRRGQKSQQVHIFSYLDTQSNLIFLSFLQVIFYRFKDTIRYLDSLFAPLRELYDIIIGN